MSDTDVVQELHSRLRRVRDRLLPPPTVRRLLRTEAGLTLRDVAEIVGVGEPSVSRWETGVRTPRGVYAERYRALLDELTHKATA